MVRSNTSSVRKRTKKYIQNTCSVKTVKKRLPILRWLPQYNFPYLIQDMIAGVTVGLTAIPQGIAYAVVAGLSPEYGLYASLAGGFVYLFFGSCKDVTIGPTAVLSTLTGKYILGYSADFAVLAAFLSGLIILAMGILQLGFLVEFISQPVITGFTTAAALQIASSQLKSLLGLAGSSGNDFLASMANLFRNIKTIRLWDSILGFATIAMLLILRRLGKGCGRTDGPLKRLRWFVSLARNAVVVIVGIIIAYIIKITLNDEPLTLIGEIGSGLPTIRPPPFSSVVGNETYTFKDMVTVLGPKAIVLPLIALLESVAIAKAFSGGVAVDATQEMVAVGLCNIVGSFASSMPITGSFARTALNHASGVQTTLGGIFTGMLIILALSLLTSTFYYIPKPTLAGLIITAMFSMVDYVTFIRLWKTSKRELLLFCITMAVCLSVGIEYGIVTGILIEALLLLFLTARPKVEINVLKGEKGDLITIPLVDSVSYCAAEHIRRMVLKAATDTTPDCLIVIDGTKLKSIDTTVASNLMSVIKDVENNSVQIMFLNFKPDLVNICVSLNPNSLDKFIVASNPVDLINQTPKSINVQT